MDIDIDVIDRNKILANFPNIIPASIIKTKIDKHPSGCYFQDIPVLDNGLAGLDYKTASKYGYIKIDLLNNSVYDNIKSKEELDELVKIEPSWEMLEYEDIVNMLPHIKDHFNIVNLIKPKNIEDLAIVLALIRPGKRYLLDKDRTTIRLHIWEKEDEYYFKKSHAYAYALAIMVKMNVILQDV